VSKPPKTLSHHFMKLVLEEEKKITNFGLKAESNLAPW